MILAVTPVVAAAFPKPVGYVNDFAGILNSGSRAHITAIAESLAEEQGIELAVVTISDIGDEILENYAVDLFAEWGIGGPEDSGILILLVLESRDLRVETGYGIETVLPAGKVGAILDQYVIPHLAKNDYNTGLVEAARVFQAVLSDESFELDRKTDDSGDLTAFLVFVAIAIFISVMARKQPPNTPGDRWFRNRRQRVSPHCNCSDYPDSALRWGGRSGGFGGFGGGRSGGGGASRKF